MQEVCMCAHISFVGESLYVQGGGGRAVCISTCTCKYIQLEVSCIASVGLTQAHPNNHI